MKFFVQGLGWYMNDGLCFSRFSRWLSAGATGLELEAPAIKGAIDHHIGPWDVLLVLIVNGCKWIISPPV